MRPSGAFPGVGSPTWSTGTHARDQQSADKAGNGSSNNPAFPSLQPGARNSTSQAGALLPLGARHAGAGGFPPSSLRPSSTSQLDVSVPGSSAWGSPKAQQLSSSLGGSAGGARPQQLSPFQGLPPARLRGGFASPQARRHTADGVELGSAPSSPYSTYTGPAYAMPTATSKTRLNMTAPLQRKAGAFPTHSRYSLDLSKSAADVGFPPARAPRSPGLSSLARSGLMLPPMSSPTAATAAAAGGGGTAGLRKPPASMERPRASPPRHKPVRAAWPVAEGDSKGKELAPPKVPGASGGKSGGDKDAAGAATGGSARGSAATAATTAAAKKDAAAAGGTSGAGSTLTTVKARPQASPHKPSRAAAGGEPVAATAAGKSRASGGSDVKAGSTSKTGGVGGQTTMGRSGTSTTTTPNRVSGKASTGGTVGQAAAKASGGEKAKPAATAATPAAAAVEVDAAALLEPEKEQEVVDKVTARCWHVACLRLTLGNGWAGVRYS